MNLQVLDHGYIRHIESWGVGDSGEMESAIIEAARQSTQGSFRGWEKDEKLLKFLYEHKHSTPFEFCGMTIEVQAPIFIFREWHRHRTQSYNEMSARYSPVPNLNYMPETSRFLLTSETNVQAQAVTNRFNNVLDETQADYWRNLIGGEYRNIEDLYQSMLANGVPKELARIILPVGRYSRMRATGNLRNWLAFLTLRMQPDAQWEIQEFAKALNLIVKDQFPRTWELFNSEMSA